MISHLMFIMVILMMLIRRADRFCEDLAYDYLIDVDSEDGDQSGNCDIFHFENQGLIDDEFQYTTRNDKQRDNNNDDRNIIIRLL